MKHFIYIMSDNRKTGIHCGYCRDSVKAVKFFKDMPTIFFPPERQNILIHLETAENETDAIERFREISGMNVEQRKEIIEFQNPDWIELVPHKHFDI